MYSVSSIKSTLTIKQEFLDLIFFCGFATFMLCVMVINLMVAMYESGPTEGNYNAILKCLNDSALAASLTLFSGMYLYFCTLTINPVLSCFYYGLFGFISYKICVFFKDHPLP
jgi:hypothetical protein